VEFYKCYNIIVKNVFISSELPLSCNVCDFIKHLSHYVLSVEFPSKSEETSHYVDCHIPAMFGE